MRLCKAPSLSYILLTRLGCPFLQRAEKNPSNLNQVILAEESGTDTGRPTGNTLPSLRPIWLAKPHWR